MADDLYYKKMRDDIYEQLRAKYMKDPESLSDGAKALLAIFATTRYMDHFDALGDMTADMERRVAAAEKIMDEVEAGNYHGPGDYSRIVDALVPLGMIETAEGYTELGDMVQRMNDVTDRELQFSTHEYEKSKGLPLTDFTDRGLRPIYFPPDEECEEIDDLSDLLNE